MAALGAERPAVRVGRTPRRKAGASGPATLYRYGPKGRTRGAPVVMVYAMVNKPFVLDLLPGASVVERFREAGRPVYLVDWGRARPEDAGRPLEEYLLGDLAGFIDIVAKRHPGSRPTLFGYCEGGIFSLLFAAARPAAVGRLILLATPVDFSKMRVLSVWTRKGQFDVGRLVRSFGNVPGSFLRQAFETLKPLASLKGELGFLDALYRKKLSEGQVEQFLAMEAWKREFVPHPGAVFKRVVEDLYQKNRLMTGRMRLGRRRVEPGRFGGPSLIAYGEKDHLVPPAAAAPAAPLLGGRATTLSFPCGHVGLSVSGRAHRDLWPRVVAWLDREEGDGSH